MNFREQIRHNIIKTRLVIISFIFIMVFVGLMADIVFNASDNSSFVNSFISLVTLNTMPYITFIVLSITLFGIFLVSKFGSKLMLSGRKYKEITEENVDFNEQQFRNIVEEISISASFNYTPRTYIMETSELNAFAAGWNKTNTFVCVTRGLLEKLTRSELEAVIAHEIGHILHGDSRLTLYVGILANIILTFTNIFSNIGYFLGSNKKENNAANVAKIVLIVLNLVLPIITQVLYLFLSRSREYMADAAAVKLTGNVDSMVSALNKINGSYNLVDEIYDDENYHKKSIGDEFRMAANIFSNNDSLFSTHPSIENRIKMLLSLK